MTRFHNLPSRRGPSQRRRQTAHYALTGQPKSFQLALDQEFAKGVETSDESSLT
jgi:hypothetical protein